MKVTRVVCFECGLLVVGRVGDCRMEVVTGSDEMEVMVPYLIRTFELSFSPYLLYSQEHILKSFEDLFTYSRNIGKVVVLTDTDSDFDREVPDASSLIPVTVAEEYYGQDVDDHDAIGLAVDAEEVPVIGYALAQLVNDDDGPSLLGGESRTAPDLEDPNKRCRVDLGSDDEEGTIIPRNICVHSNPSTIERHVEALLSPLDERRLHELGCAASSDDLVSSIYRALSDAIFIRRDRKQLDKENTVLKKSNKVLQEENKKVIEKLNTLQKKIEETDKELVNEKGEISWFVCSAR
ncbi:hypothetical protein G4B88_002741 [Cannabis sativa]|uniref:Uncharacterized protein n=1 Tax=Cannabis sativa TaxID=3483 RepID=A0A7J6HHV9_CANSA|nr:hypothetical protein G4B88_002741 [Cannabis sativa]